MPSSARKLSIGLQHQGEGCARYGTGHGRGPKGWGSTQRRRRRRRRRHPNQRQRGEDNEGKGRGRCCMHARFDDTLGNKLRAREQSRMTGAALGRVIGRRPLVARQTAGRPQGRLGGAGEGDSGRADGARRRWERLRVMKMVDSSLSSLSEEESDPDPMAQQLPAHCRGRGWRPTRRT